MEEKKLFKESGFTLIELLATLAISMLVLGVIYSALTSSDNFNKKTQSHINLRQEANIIITQLRQQHRGETYDICYDQLVPFDKVIFEKLNLNRSIVSKGDCISIDPTKDLEVKFTLADLKNNTFDIDTIIESKKGNAPVEIVIENPKDQDSDFYNYLKNNNIFVFSSNLSAFGSTLINGPGNMQSTLVVNNSGNSSIQFPGNNTINVKDIYIDKKGGTIKFSSSTKLGVIDKTNTVFLRGEVDLNNGGAEINGDTIIIDGKVNFSNSGKIKGKKVYINGDVTFRNWSAQIEADEIYISGEINYITSKNLLGTLKTFTNEMISTIKESTTHAREIPSFRDNDWYEKNGYIIDRNAELANNVKVFSETNYQKSDISKDLQNIIIVSKGDIILHNQWKSISGVLIAPNGLVKFEGNSFKGIIISKNGFEVVNGGSKVEFSNVNNFIPSADLFPLK
ncbi:type II secretion system protein [Bacillus sp. Bva_UNVM-123]|uniref:PilW family protein n=1 Tax=Bacillus sp. Bva_UNVM-123 TaxID=2829798 RepID=UPI00391EFE2D